MRLYMYVHSFTFLGIVSTRLKYIKAKLFLGMHSIYSTVRQRNIIIEPLPTSATNNTTLSPPYIHILHVNTKNVVITLLKSLFFLFAFIFYAFCMFLVRVSSG